MFANLENKTIGTIFKNSNIFKPSSDLFLVDFTRGKIQSSNTIVHYFAWDRDFHTIETIDKYCKHLDKLKKRGVKIVCQTDFSAWYNDTTNRINAVRKNFNYLDLAIKKGFQVIVNFNNIFADDFEFWHNRLPFDIPSVIMDMNHNEIKFAKLEYNALKLLLDNHRVKTFIIKTNKRQIPKEYQEFFNLLRINCVNIEFQPTERSILEIRYKKYYK